MAPLLLTEHCSPYPTVSPLTRPVGRETPASRDTRRSPLVSAMPNKQSLVSCCTEDNGYSAIPIAACSTPLGLSGKNRGIVKSCVLRNVDQAA